MLSPSDLPVPTPCPLLLLCPPELWFPVTPISTMRMTLYTFYSHIRSLLGSFSDFTMLFPPDVHDCLLQKIILCYFLNPKRKTHYPVPPLICTAAINIKDGNYASAGSLIPCLRHVHAQLLQYLPPSHSPPQSLMSHPLNIPLEAVIPGPNRLTSYSLVVSPNRNKVFPDVNKTQLTLDPQTVRPWRFKWNALFNDAQSK
eukprot:jgi/Psemu1/45367/gm1.45367_g